VAIASIALPILMSLAWLFFVRRFDRAQPEPMWLVLATFALGGLSVIPAGFAEYLLMSSSPYLNPDVMTLGGQLIGLLPGLVVFTVVVGMSEEGSKFLGAWSLARHRHEFDEPIDGMVYGAASALGLVIIQGAQMRPVTPASSNRWIRSASGRAATPTMTWYGSAPVVPDASRSARRLSTRVRASSTG